MARSPRKPLIALQQSLSEITGPVFGHDLLQPLDNDLLLNGKVSQEPVGERIIVHGRVLDENGRPVPNTLIEIWQANAGGKYRHVNDHYVAADRPELPRLRPDAVRRGRLVPVPHHQARPLSLAQPAQRLAAGPHPLSRSSATAFVTRLITQLYFEGDPLLRHCPIYQSIPDAGARERLVAHARPRRDDPLGHDRLPLRHRPARPAPDAVREQAAGSLTPMLSETASQTAGPYLHIGMMPSAAGHRRRVGQGLERAGRARARRASASASRA